jgi:selenocysteine lyase/cysteine desulfurase
MKENINPTDYEKHLEAGRKYYENNRDRLLKKQTKYRREHKTEDARRKILKWLNNDPDYINIVRQTTIDKYKIQKSNGRYI